jgi:acyl-CoA thioesterase
VHNPGPLPYPLGLERTGERVYRAELEPARGPRDVVFGGQLLAQMLIASALEHDFAKEVKSIHAIFARAGTFAEPLLFDVETLHDGRTFGSDSVTCRQAGKVVSRALVLLTVDEPDLIRHQAVETAAHARPVSGTPTDGRVFPGAEAAAGDGDKPGVLAVWTRYPPGDDRVAVHQAVLAWATDGYLIGPALSLHPGFSEDMAHRTVSTGVVSHTINFHERFDASQWLLLSNESVWAGRGRAYGRGSVFTGDGRLVATYTQDSMVRAFADGGSPGAPRPL